MIKTDRGRISLQRISGYNARNVGVIKQYTNQLSQMGNTKYTANPIKETAM